MINSSVPLLCIYSHFRLKSFIMFSFVFLVVTLFNSLDQAFVSSSSHKSTVKFVFSAPLIHRSSPESPFFDRNYTREDHIEGGILASLARARYFSQIKATKNEYVTPAPILGWNMLLKYSLGTPSFETYGIFDTGSSFTWIQCLPCIHCHDQKGYALFDPKSSSSYQKVRCFDRECTMAPSRSCGGSEEEDPSPCHYYAAYVDNTTSRGIVSTETLTLSNKITSRVVFGCGIDNNNNVGIPGVVGVGNLSLSLIHQLSLHHFSYFVFANGTHLYGTVDLGPGSSMTNFGMTTPLLPNDHGLYYLNLTGISVDGSDLDLPSGIFEKGLDSDGSFTGFVIDSGTTYSMIRSEAFDVLKSALMEAMYELTPEESANNFELCYRDVSEAPEVVFQFSGLDYIVCNANLWVSKSGLYCLAMMRLKESVGKLSILGFHQQRNVEVGYDLEKNLLSFVYPGACPDDPLDFLP